MIATEGDLSFPSVATKEVQMLIKDKIIEYMENNCDSNGMCDFSVKDFSNRFNIKFKSVNSQLHLLKKQGAVKHIKRGSSLTPARYQLVNIGEVTINNSDVQINISPINEIQEQMNSTLDAFVGFQEKIYTQQLSAQAELARSIKIQFNDVFSRLSSIENDISQIKDNQIKIKKAFMEG